MSVRDTLNNAHIDAQRSVDVVMAAARLSARDGLLFGTQDVPDDLGMQVELFNRAGALTDRQTFGAALALEPIELASLGAGLDGKRQSRTIRLRDGRFIPEGISARDLIAGGTFGEENIIPLSATANNEAGAIRIVSKYPDMTTGARMLVLRSIVAAYAIAAGLLLGTWKLLQSFVADPLREYSTLALQIAAGQPVRMPAHGMATELETLARAVNGMADALEHRATIDTLTGLYNLTHLSSHLEALLTEATLAGEPLSLVFADLDDLKQVNDLYGHQTGDRVLKAVSEAMARWAGKDQVCWRLGGDEFVVALPDVSEAEALALASGLRQVIASQRVLVGQTVIQPSISVGTSTFPEDGTSAGTLLSTADQRMYVAKSARKEERRLAGLAAA